MEIVKLQAREKRIRITDETESTVETWKICADYVYYGLYRNKLIIDLEKNKMQQERKDFKEKLLRENALASKKMTALEKNYRDQLDMLSE